MHTTLFVFDIETVPDLSAAMNLLGQAASSNDLRQKLEEYHLHITDGKSAFFRQPFHKIVAVSFLEATIEYHNGYELYRLKQLRSGGNIDSSEEELVRGLFHYLGSITPRLVTFNGKTFDLPVLKYRAMLYGIQAEWLYKSGDKWNNYNTKYSLNWHCDLLEALSDYRASARVKMNEVCAMLGLPGKIDIEGSMVESMYYEGRIEEIRNYCELDVLNTYLLYLRYAHHTCTISKQSYNTCVTDVLSFLEQHQASHSHFALFLKEWRKSYSDA